MQSIKSYTDINQSKALAEFLPLESADMVYIKHLTSSNPDWRFDDDIPPMILRKTSIKDMTVEVLPCWSLAALLDILPICERKGYQKSKPQLLYNTFVNKWIVFGHAYTTDAYDNQIDACVDMILKLHELKML